MTERESFHVNLTECADLLGTTTETLRKIVAKAAENGFPIVERGKNGVSYVIDAGAAAEWWSTNKEAREAAQAARASDLHQMRLELFGGELSEDEAERFKMSGRQRREEYEAEMAAIRLSRARGELCDLAEVEQAFAAAIVALRQDLLSLPDRIGKRLSLSRDQRAAIDEMVIAALNRAADRMTLAETYRAAA